MFTKCKQKKIEKKTRLDIYKITSKCKDLPFGPDNEEEVVDVEYNVCHGALLEVLLRERVKGVNPHPTLVLLLEGDANTAQLGVCVKNQKTL